MQYPVKVPNGDGTNRREYAPDGAKPRRSRVVYRSAPVVLGPPPDPRAVCAYRVVKNDADALDRAAESLAKIGWTVLHAAIVSESPKHPNCEVACWAVRP